MKSRIGITKHLSACLSRAYDLIADKDDTDNYELAIWYIEQELTIEQPIHLQPSLIIDNLNLVLSNEECALTAEAMRHIVYANTCGLPERRQHLARAISIIVDMVLVETGGIM